MNIIRVKLCDMHPAEKNVRIHSDKQLSEMERSIKMFGQIRPIVIDEENTILAGNGLYAALKRMGVEEADACQMVGLSDNQRKKLMIADNKIYSLGVDNLQVLDEFLNELQGDLDVPGFDEDILLAMVEDADEVTERISEYGNLEPEDLQQIQANGERKEQKISAAVEIGTAPDRSPEQSDLAVDESEAEARKCVICPKCGERIWL